MQFGNIYASSVSGCCCVTTVLVFCHTHASSGIKNSQQRKKTKQFPDPTTKTRSMKYSYCTNLSWQLINVLFFALSFPTSAPLLSRPNSLFIRVVMHISQIHHFSHNCNITGGESNVTSHET